MKKINSASEALEVFNAKFAGLIGEVKGEFKKRFIQTPDANIWLMFYRMISAKPCTLFPSTRKKNPVLKNTKT